MVQAAYFHIPFCQHICHYCDFNKVFLKGQPVEEYLSFLDKEVQLTLENHPNSKMKTIFIGGGTPTALNEPQLETLVTNIRNRLSYDEQTEYTVEANPGDLSEEKLRILKDAGVNRLSFGVQSFSEELLKKIGRTHRAKDVFETLDKARKVGFENISLDLIYSLPGQTVDDFKSTLKTAFSLDVQHFSSYSLIIEPKTVFYILMQKGKLPLPGEDTEAIMYEILMDEMEKNNYKQYEISNFSRPGYESKHNLTYWNNEEYFGFGAGAHSYVNGVRIGNYGPLKKYLEPLKQNVLPTYENNVVSKSEMMEEELFLGLRKTSGVDINQFIAKFEEDPRELFKQEIHQLVDRELINVKEQISLTRKGKLLGNEVFQSFIGG